jgi:hypothetical protein
MNTPRNYDLNLQVDKRIRSLALFAEAIRTQQGERTLCNECKRIHTIRILIFLSEKIVLLDCGL